MEFRVARAANRTGATLAKLVRERLVEAGTAEPDCVVCYGAGYAGPKAALNAACSHMDKKDQGIKLNTSIGTLESLVIFEPEQAEDAVRRGPLVARKRKHTKGKDILVCRTLVQVRRAIERGRAYFTPLVESETEYRVWVYRKRVLCAYEKQLTEPEKNVKFGRNRDNGWTFHRVEVPEVPERVRVVAVAAVAALGLDFGAVDILGTAGGGAVVLEVNSAPGVSDEHRAGITTLANRVARWVTAGCPQRAQERTQ